MEKENKVIILSGPTATGKTSLGVSLAKKYGLEIINFDSLLFYRELNIGTAKPTLQEMDGVPHHLMSFQSAQSPINSAQFYRLALDKTKTLHTQRVIPLFVGGSAFYLRALLKGLYKSSPPSQKILEKSRCLYQKKGIRPFLDILQEYDPIHLISFIKMTTIEFAGRWNTTGQAESLFLVPDKNGNNPKTLANPISIPGILPPSPSY